MKQAPLPLDVKVVATTLDARAFTLLCVTALCVLAAHATHLPPWFTVPLVAILALRWRQRRRMHRRVGAGWRVVMLLAIPIAVLASWRTPFGRQPGTAILCSLLVLKLLESETVRDARMAVGFACFALMAVLLFDQSLPLTIVVALLLLAPLATLRALEPGIPDRRWLPAFRPGATLLLASLPIALLGFLLIPRLATPLWGTPNQGAARTGISSEMAPGELYSLLKDNSVAMRIGFDAAPPPPDKRYFRGMVLWDFDGRTWRRGWLAHRDAPPRPLQSPAALVGYEITLEPTHRHWLFALDMPTGAPAGTRMGPDHTLRAGKPVDRVLRYHVASATHYQLDPHDLEPRERAAALELPPGFDPRARALAAQWRDSSGGDTRRIVDAALGLIHNGGFVYDLDAPPLGRDSIDEFLFDTKTGFCEHYASAFTFLMRAAGVPARVVVGYQGGYWNSIANYLLVRQSDAHAWTEVWIAGAGWVRVDPTAAVSKIIMASTGGAASDITGGGSSWWMPWRNRLDVVNRWWNLSFVEFDALRQGNLFRPFGIPHASAQMLAIALAVIAFLALGFGALLAAWRPHARPRDGLAAAQARLQRRLARAGVERGTSEGPRDFYQRATRRFPAATPNLAVLGAEYLALRYGCSEPPPERVRAFSRSVHRLRPGSVVK